MRRLFIVIAILAALFSGYWAVASRAVNSGAAQALTGLQAQGVEVAYSGLSTAGFPGRFDTTLTGAKIMDTASGYGWAGDSVQVFAPSYLPNTVTLVAPPTQVITTPAGDVTLAAEGLRASGSVGLSSDLPLTSVRLESGPGSVDVPVTGRFGFASILATLEPAAEPLVYAVASTITGLTFPAVSAPVDDIRLEGTVTLDRTLDKAALSTVPQPVITALSLSDSHFSWGGGTIVATGSLTVTTAGYPEGAIALTVTGWQNMVDSAVTTGLIAPEVARTYQNMGTMLANGSTDIALPLTFAQGQMALGPFPLGPAPRLR